MAAYIRKLFIILMLFSLVSFLIACSTGPSKAKLQEQEAAAAAQAEADREREQALAAQAYTEVNAAHDMLDEMVSDIYKAWHWAIHEAKDDICSLALLAKEMDRPINELKRGFAYGTNEGTWGDLSVGDRQKKINRAESDFKLLLATGFSRFSACVLTVRGVYMENGNYREAEQHLQAAEQALDTLHEAFPDSQYYAALKEYYATETAMAAYCRSVDGSLEQAKTTINDYRNDVRKLKAELELLIKNK